MALNRYLRMALLVDSVLQIEATEVTVNFDGKQQDVETLVQGLAGFTPGAKTLEIDGKWAMPAAGAEFDVVTACATGDLHELQVPYGNKTIVSKGIFKSGSLGGSVSANTALDAKFTGTFDPPT
jgi:hypothetical protein